MRRKKHSIWFALGAGMFEALAVAGILWVAQLGRVESPARYDVENVSTQLEQSASALQYAVVRHVNDLVAP